MEKQFSAVDWVVLVLVLIGALNWGLVGFFSFDLVKTIFGDMTVISRVIYAIVGVAALYLAFISPRLTKK